MGIKGSDSIITALRSSNSMNKTSLVDPDTKKASVVGSATLKYDRMVTVILWSTGSAINRHRGLQIRWFSSDIARSINLRTYLLVKC